MDEEELRLIMDEEELKKFLIGWLMEFGMQAPDGAARSGSEWYGNPLVPSVYTVSVDVVGKNYLKQTADRFFITQAGLDFIKEK